MEFIRGLDTVEEVKNTRQKCFDRLQELYITTEKTVEGNSIKKEAITKWEDIFEACNRFLIENDLEQGDTSVTQPYWI